MDESMHQTLLPGLKPILELLREQPEKIDKILYREHLRAPELKEITTLCQQQAIPCKIVTKDILDKICARQGTQGSVLAHQGIVARLVSFAFCALETALTATLDAPLPLLLALDAVQDPGNIGTLVRTLYTLGGGGLLVENHATAHLGPAAHKTAAGALERLPIVRVPHLGRALDTAEEHGFTLYGSTGNATEPRSVHAFASPLSLPAVLVLGNEAKGLRPDIKKRCSTLLAIPQKRRFNSLNVAQAGAILIGMALAFKENAIIPLNSL